MEDCAFHIENFVGESVKEFRNIDVRLTKIEATLPYLATKADLTDLRTDMMTEISGVRVDMAKMESKLIKWFVCSVVAIGALIVASNGILPAILQRFF